MFKIFGVETKHITVDVGFTDFHGVSLQPVRERDEGVANGLGVIYI